jgi:hypothetical protein
MKFPAPIVSVVGSDRQGTLLRSMSPVVGLRPTPPPLLAQSRVPYRPERLPPCLFGGSKQLRIAPGVSGVRFPQVKEEGRRFFGPGDTEGIGRPTPRTTHV